MRYPLNADSRRNCQVPEEGKPDLVLTLVKLGIDRASDVPVKRGVTECVEQALRDSSDDNVSRKSSQI